MKREERKQGFIESIVNAGFRCLAQKPWNEITSDELAKTAGMTKRTMYAYFSSQDELYLHLVKVSFERFNRHIEPSLVATNSISETLLAVGNAYFAFYRSHPVEGRLIVSFDESLFEAKHPDAIKAIAEIANRYEPSRILRESGTDPIQYPPSLGLFLWSSIQGLLSLLDSKASWMHEYYQADYDSMVKDHMNWLKTILPQETRNGE